MDACLFSLLFGYNSEHDISRTCSRRTDKNKRFLECLFNPWLHMCVYAIADMCLSIAFYCGFSKNRFLLQKHNFRLLLGLLGPEWPGTPINRYPPALQDRIVRDLLIAVPANARRCCQVHRHISGGGRERRGLEWQMNKKPSHEWKK